MQNQPHSVLITRHTHYFASSTFAMEHMDPFSHKFPPIRRMPLPDAQESQASSDGAMHRLSRRDHHYHTHRPHRHRHRHRDKGSDQAGTQNYAVSSPDCRLLRKAADGSGHALMVEANNDCQKGGDDDSAQLRESSLGANIVEEPERMLTEEDLKRKQEKRRVLNEFVFPCLLCL